MQALPIRVLLVEHELADVECVKRALLPGINTPFELCHVGQLSDAFEHLRAGGFDVLLLDLGLPEYCGVEALQAARSKNPIITRLWRHWNKEPKTTW